MRMQYDVELNASGDHCPIPIVKTRALLKTLCAGQVIKVISTDPMSVADFTVFVARHALELLAVEHSAHTYVFYIKICS
jgi:tRNA 2-thiouridine synthesizing protein A